jgi:phosphate transport system substrate-binding protein
MPFTSSKEISVNLNRHWVRTPMTLAFAGLLLLTACNSGSSASATGGSSGGAGDLEGSLFVSGSSTVEPISRANAEKFAAEAPNVDISVEGPGTSDGFALFCAGDSDVSDASRAIKPEEVAECEANGIDFIELYIAIDGLSVITSTHNDAVDCLSFTDLWALLGPEAGGNGTNWSDADDLAQQTFDATGGEFGDLHTPYPSGSISITAPGEESGTFDSFIEIALDPIGAVLQLEDVTTTPNYQSSGDDNVIIQGVAGSEDSPDTLGWVGFAYVEENLDLVKPLAIDGSAGCVEPTTETIASGEYPIARPLYVYVNAASADDNPALAAFIDFYLSDEGRASVGEVGYVDIPDEDWDASVATWDAKTTGTQVE